MPEFMVHRLEMHYSKEDITRTNHDIHCLFTVAHFSKRKLKQKQKNHGKIKLQIIGRARMYFMKKHIFKLAYIT